MNIKTLEISKKLKTRDQGNKQVPMPAFSLSVSTKSKILSHSFDTMYRLQKTGTIMGCIQGMETNKKFPIELELIH